MVNHYTLTDPLVFSKYDLILLIFRNIAFNIIYRACHPQTPTPYLFKLREEKYTAT